MTYRVKVNTPPSPSRSHLWRPFSYFEKGKERKNKKASVKVSVSVCTVVREHIMNTGSGRPSTLDTRISVVYYHTPSSKRIYPRDLVWVGSVPQERWFGSVIRLHRLGRVGIKEYGPKENTVTRTNDQFRMSGTHPQTFDTEKWNT